MGVYGCWSLRRAASLWRKGSGDHRLAWLAWSPDLGMARHGDSRTTLDTPLPESLPEAKKQDFAGCESLHDALHLTHSWECGENAGKCGKKKGLERTGQEAPTMGWYN